MSPTEEIKSRLDIIDVIGEYITLKPSGVNHKACCPFHEEKTASFMVSKPKQIWHCFGCGEGGDIFSFVMKQEGLEFPDALRLLAVKAGVQVRTESVAKRTEREKIGKVLAEAVKFWQETLWKSEEAREARRYIQDDRLILPETTREWRLGFASNSWDSLVTHLAKLGIPEEDMIKAGVAVRKMATTGRTVYDRFRNRIMFPLTNAHGQVVGATGRAMPGSDTEAKYVNTPETLLYRKGQILYGLDKAKVSIRQQDLLVAVEGNVDVISSHQAGATNVVATSGTALTADQINLVKRYTNNIAFAFDTDAAGESATMRGLITALSQGLEVSLISLPQNKNGDTYKDPDECIRENPDAWMKAIKAKESLLDYYFRRAREEKDLIKLEDKKAVVKTLLPLLARVPDAVTVSHYLQKLSALVGVSESQLREAMPQKETVSSPKHSVNRPIATDRPRALSERLLSAFVSRPSVVPYIIEEITPEMLASTLSELYKEMIVFYTENKVAEQIDWLGTAFAKQLSKNTSADVLKSTLDVLSLLAEEEFSKLSTEELRQEVIDISSRLKKRHLSDVLHGLERSIRDVEASVPRDEDKLQALLQEFHRLSSELTKLDSI